MEKDGEQIWREREDSRSKQIKMAFKGTKLAEMAREGLQTEKRFKD